MHEQVCAAAADSLCQADFAKTDDTWSLANHKSRASGIQRLQAKKNTVPLAIAAVIVLTICAGFRLLGAATTPGSSYASALKDRKSKDAQLVSNWLDAQRRGRPGAEYWLSETWVKPVRLYAVSSWEIVSNDLGTIVVRVDSSNQAGLPIRKLWKVELTDLHLRDKSPEYEPRIRKVAEPD
jgi:hypothetical protein